MKQFFIALALVIGFSAVSQNVTLREHKSNRDSISDYPYALPILGKKATKKGYKLPLPHGVMFNFLAGKQELAIEDMKVGFNNGPLYDVSDIIDFGPSEAVVYTFNVRVDTWILPFLNIGGYYGQGESQAKIRLEKPFELVTEPRSDATYYGFSTLLAGGYKGLFNKGFMLSWDLNASWTTNENLDKPVFVAITGIRTGPIIPLKKENSNIVIWGGAAYTYVAAETVGSIGGSEIFPEIGDNIDEKRMELDTWYANFGDNPPESVTKIYDGMNGVYDNIENGVNSSSIQYSMTKKALGPINFVLGMQYQLNLHWQLRLEAQMLGGRTTGLVSMNYRFGL